ncbi:uncharacterized protein PAE49_013852 [Odontesthes bonariensis]|uniref:uncharacterized protein LOC142396562 n=1 Tax=Odontesthes bonariensis TaxID=219752 RepID=UPI003F587DBD
MEILGERRTRNLWTFLGLLMVLTVSGVDGVQVKSFLNGSVLLPCPCMGINLQMDVKWQSTSGRVAEYGRKELVFKLNKTGPYVGDNYTGRVETFLSKNNHNCSVLLTNITAADRGEYKCIFYRKKLYTSEDVNLHVCGTADISQRTVTHGNPTKVFTACHVKECSAGVEIQWTSEKNPLTNSAQTTINISEGRLDTSTGLYHFNSSLSTNNVTLDPKCEVRSKEPDIQPRKEPEVSTDIFRILFKLIPAVSALGLVLFLFFR